eukprot:398069-Hanusia_phi.AAC.1
MPVQMTSDDLVGSVQVDLQEIPVGEPRELMLPLQNQQLLKKLRDTRLMLIVLKLNEPQGEEEEAELVCDAVASLSLGRIGQRRHGKREEEEEEEEEEDIANFQISGDMVIADA